MSGRILGLAAMGAAALVLAACNGPGRHPGYYHDGRWIEGNYAGDARDRTGARRMSRDDRVARNIKLGTVGRGGGSTGR